MFAFAVAAVFAGGASPPARAEGTAQASTMGPLGKDLFESSDFRVRVGAALALGKTRPRGSRASLERALQDPHPAVRTAAAAALSLLADPTAAPAIERAAASEEVAPVKVKMTETAQGLRRGVAPPFTLDGKQFVLQIAATQTSPDPHTAALAETLGAAMKAEAARVRGGAFIEGTDAQNLARAKARRLPILVLQGPTVTLSQSTDGSGTVTLTAKVDCNIKRLSDHTLRGTLSGSASAQDREAVLEDEPRLLEIHRQLVAAAVESALRGADKGLQAAAK